ncbi:BON domain-containing protein [Hahella ganghwensis]|uniref:BON domain-containing protein n=1 Tax=Hahella ganghwensis TaxID=286420 RepID=UPI00037B18E8|nr:BON domain-containing protein [Hahella ganghwensis]
MKNPINSAIFSLTTALILMQYSTASAAATPGDVADVRREVQISTTYALSPFLRADDIQVEVINGKATITGTVNEDVNKDLAEQIALGVKGIKEVDNKIKVDVSYVASTKAKERNFVEVVEDATVTAAVKSKLMWSKYADGLSTNVDTASGKVTLQGTASSPVAKEMAGRLAMNTRGVTEVDNQLKVTDEAPTMKDKVVGSMDKASQQISDSWITTKVKSTFTYSNSVNSSAISVTTKNGNVTLSGQLADGAERALAIQLAESVRGVNQVNVKELKD